MIVRYDIERDVIGWMIVDTLARSLACINNVPHIFLSFEDADDLADCVNDLHVERLSPPNTDRSRRPGAVRPKWDL
jgi:hypothetical protein